MEERRLKPSEREAWLELMQAAFGERELFDRYLEHDTGLSFDDTFVIFDGPRLAAGLQIFTRTLQLRGRPVTIGGLGSVATHPDYEGRGLGTRNLQRAVAELERRRVFASLLFSTREGFYGRLGWESVPQPMWSWRPAAPTRASGEPAIRPFVQDDLPAVAALYAQRRGELHTLRDEAYWRGQLRCAGEPDEDFRVATREGAVVGWARAIRRDGIQLVIELGEREGARALGPLLAALARYAPAPERPLFVPDDGSPGLEAELRGRARRLDRVHFPDPMWRLVDREAARRLAGVGEEATESELLRELFGRPGSCFWLSDRF